MNKHYSIYHFSLNLPINGKQNDIQSLLRHLADNLNEPEYKDIEIQDIVFHNQLDHETAEWVPGFTVYYSLNDDNAS